MLGTQTLYLKLLVQASPKQMPTPQKHDIDGLSVAWSFSTVCRRVWPGVAPPATTDMGGCKNVCALRIYEQGISAISKRDTQAARIYGDFSEQRVYTPVYEDAFFVALQPGNGEGGVSAICDT